MGGEQQRMCAWHEGQQVWCLMLLCSCLFWAGHCMIETLGECSTTRGLVGTSRHEVGLPEKSREDLGPQWRCTRNECELPPPPCAVLGLSSHRPGRSRCIVTVTQWGRIGGQRASISLHSALLSVKSHQAAPAGGCLGHSMAVLRFRSALCFEGEKVRSNP